MSIGEDLAQARRRAGLTVTQVSQRTCIRETIIRGIERDDYGACGGDFYARGHIRALARAMGADPGPFIAGYDAGHPAREVPAAGLLRLSGPVSIRQPRRLKGAAVLGLALAAALGFAAYQVSIGLQHAPKAPAAAGLHRPVHRHPHRVTRPTAPGPYARTVVIHLIAVEDCWVEFTTPDGGYLFQAYVAGGTSRRWAFRHAVDMRLGNPGGIRLTIDGRTPLPPGTAEPITLRLGLQGKISI